ncbi:MAG: hypothetical protein AAB391_00240 [Patescibacteria group bacterium]
MKGTPLSDANDVALTVRAIALGMKLALNLPKVFTLRELEHYEANLDELPGILRNGSRFTATATQEGATQTEPPPRPSFAFADTNALKAIEEAEDFAEKHFGHRPDLRKQFTMPKVLPWKIVIAVYDPGTLTHRQAVEQALKAQPKLKSVYEERDLMDYKDAKASGKPTLRFVERSTQPTPDTMNLTADEMVATGRVFLDLRGYIIAFGMYHKVTGHFLDPKTWTRFPTSRLPDGGVASGYWFPGYSKVRFDWDYAGYRGSDIGGREAVNCALATP